MRINVIGAGPAGLLLSLLVKTRFPHWRVRVLEQNPPDATFGFGVVFSLNALAFLQRDLPDLYAELAPRLESWPMQRIVHRDQRIEIYGNGFSAIGRLELNRFLQTHCAGAGVEMVFGREITSVDELPPADLLVGADGANSTVRRALAAEFAPVTEWLTNRFAWYGTAQFFDCLSLTFRRNEHGCFVAHHYRHSPRMSTFVVECDQQTWRRAGLDQKSDAESRAYCERVFAADLEGRRLVSNKSIWRQFALVAARRWLAGNAVLLGDALRTVHFSIGSGTRLAFEDAIALARALTDHSEDVAGALAAFERERRPIVEKIVAAANASSYWYERLPEKMDLTPLGLAYDYMMRSGRMTDERLRELSPEFMARVDAERRREA